MRVEERLYRFVLYNKRSIPVMDVSYFGKLMIIVFILSFTFKEYLKKINETAVFK